MVCMCAHVGASVANRFVVRTTPLSAVWTHVARRELKEAIEKFLQGRNDGQHRVFKL